MDPMEMALHWLEDQDKANCAKAAEKFDVDRVTLWRRWTKRTVSRAESTSLHKTLFTTAQELELIE
jgi:predicted DNA-binding protein (UPF0251 family)